MDTTNDTKMQLAMDATIAPEAAAEFITGLLERIEQLESDLATAENDAAHQKALAESALRVAEGWERKCDALRAKIQRMEKQEPVASVWRCDNGHIHGSCERTLPMGTKLYILPGAKGE